MELDSLITTSFWTSDTDCLFKICGLKTLEVFQPASGDSPIADGHDPPWWTGSIADHEILSSVNVGGFTAQEISLLRTMGGFVQGWSLPDIKVFCPTVAGVSLNSWFALCEISEKGCDNETYSSIEEPLADIRRERETSSGPLSKNTGTSLNTGTSVKSISLTSFHSKSLDSKFVALEESFEPSLLATN